MISEIIVDLAKLKSIMTRLYEQLQNTVALSVIAAGSDFDNHDQSITGNYWNITLDHLHQTDLLCRKAMELLDLPTDED